MTIRQMLEDKLVNHGLWPDEAKKVMEAVAAHPASESMQGRWDSESDGYPAQLIPVLWIGVKTRAVEWIDVNKPKHFARAILIS